jgi:PTS system cellobiose-specific IIB component
MSTSLIVRRMEAAAAERGMDIDVKAYTVTEVDSRAPEAQVVLVGPQVRYRMKEVERICKPLGIPIGVIPMSIYGLMNGNAILDFALNTYEGA